jgi:hypothetical protein
MQPTYLHQTYLPVNSPVPRGPTAYQPFLDTAIDTWLNANQFDSWSNTAFLRGYLAITDVPSDQVLCTVILVATEVRYYLPSLIFVISVVQRVLSDAR